MASLLAPHLLERVEKCSSEEQAISHLKRQVVERLSKKRLELRRDPEDRRDVPTDNRYLQLLLSASRDPVNQDTRQITRGQQSQTCTRARRVGTASPWHHFRWDVLRSALLMNKKSYASSVRWWNDPWRRDLN